MKHIFDIDKRLNEIVATAKSREEAFQKTVALLREQLEVAQLCASTLIGMSIKMGGRETRVKEVVEQGFASTARDAIEIGSKAAADCPDHPTEETMDQLMRRFNAERC